MTGESKRSGKGYKDGLNIGQVSELTGVSRRMLRHWEREGLISPIRSQSNYRQYMQEDVARLERIVIYREIGFNARQIKAVLNYTTPRALDELLGERLRIEEKVQLLRKAADRLDRLIALTEGKSGNDSAAAKNNRENQYFSEAHERWGSSRQWLEYAERKASRSEQEQKKDMARLRDVESKLAQAKRKGLAPTSDEVLKQIDEHRQALSWFHVTPSMHVIMGRMYMADARFRRHYEQLEPGLAQWMLTAIESAADANGIDPATAKWE
ncbi:TipAS antibiotic-recognition domain-containing protein [uncultured Bifidobacterium sp.]|uniref:MerR family transcriptional regulator n=1 Tax=uncultured Bifidobacterium sp. TaxID=165187 RepID=UPI002630D5D8|nr:TipAS antibiotic-recognition domain-containing protein [uncultured Bifidobacterium sp.]